MMCQTTSEQTELAYAIVENSSEPCIALNRHWHVIYVNPEAEKLLGLSRYHVEGKNFWELFPEGIGSAFRRSLEEGMARRVTVELEAYSSPFSRWIACRVVPHFTHGEFNALFVFARDTTAHHADLEALRQHYEIDCTRLAAIVYSSDDLIYSTTLDGVILSWNKAGESLYGYTAQEAIGQHVSFVIPPARYHEYEETMGPIRQGESVEPFETERRCKDGTLLQVETRISPLQNDRGQVTAASVISRDITERKVQEARNIALNRDLQRSVSEFSTLFETIPVAIVVADDPLGKFIRGNAETRRLLNHPSTSNLSRSAPEPDRPQTFRAMREGHEIPADDLPMQKAARTGKVVESEFDIVWNDGTTLQIVGRAGPLFDESGRSRGSIGAFLESTEQMKLRLLLQIEARRARALVESNTSGILIYAFDGRIFDANDALLAMIGYSREDVTEGRLRWDELTPPEYGERDAEAIKELTLTGRCEPFEKRLICKDGSLLPILVSTALVDLSQGECVCWITDLTQVKANEQERAYVLSAARCMLYYADVTQSDHPDQLYWDSHFMDEKAAQAFMPLKLEPGERYEQARYRSRHPEDRDQCDAYGTRMIRAGKNYTQEFRSSRADGSICWLREDVHVDTIVPGDSWRVVCVCTDITELKEQQRALQTANEQLLLAGITQHELRDVAENLNRRLQRSMTETHHRVKNNLQIIAAMVDIQVMEGTETLPTAAVKRLGEQVAALAALHDLLTNESRTDRDAQSLDAFEVLSKLMPLVQAAAGATDIAYRVDHARLCVSQAASLCLIANEIITNAVKHGRGSVNVAFNADGRDAELVVDDNGPGFPEGFSPETMSNHGLELVCHLARWDLSGSLEFETRQGGGGRVTLKMPAYPKAFLAQEGFTTRLPAQSLHGDIA